MPIYQGLSPQAYATTDRYIRTPVTKSYYSQPTTPAAPAAPEIPEGFSIEDIDPEVLKHLAATMGGGDGGGGDYTDDMPDNRTLEEKKDDALVGMATAPDLTGVVRGPAIVAGLNALAAGAAGLPIMDALGFGMKSIGNTNPVILALQAANAVVPSIRASRGMRQDIPSIKEQFSPVEYDRARSQAMISETGKDPYRDAMLSDNDLAATSPGELTGFSGMTAPAANDLTESFKRSSGGIASDMGLAQGMQNLGYSPPKTGYNRAAFAIGNAVQPAKKNARPYTTQLWEYFTEPPVSKTKQSFKSQVLEGYIKPTMSKIMRSITNPLMKGTGQPGVESQNPEIGLTQGPIATNISLLDSGDGGGGGGFDVGDIGIGTDSDVGIAMGGGDIGLSGTAGISLGGFSVDDDVGDDYGGLW